VSHVERLAPKLQRLQQSSRLYCLSPSGRSRAGDGNTLPPHERRSDCGDEIDTYEVR
jgi:hypothetical protein